MSASSSCWGEGLRTTASRNLGLVVSNSKIARDFLGDTFVEHFAATRDWEWRQWLDGVTDWELKRYFEII